jgi:hypothetical protein
MWAPALSPLEYGVKLRRLAFPADFNMPAAGFAFRDDYIANHGARLGRAFATGEVGCFANKDACVKLF